ncbi:hypothetical protein EDB85DRAFT_1892641 [Lactarius pseudohatsudake]|nr:hypothetical protein EDB85DRAFT_1892641 [Lactarius pseudohatsudake]
MRPSWPPLLLGAFVRNWGAVHNSRVAPLAARPHEETRYAKTLKARERLIKKLIQKHMEEIESTVGGELRDFFIPSFQCPRHVERVGVLGDGGKGVCGMGRNAEQEKMSSTRSVARAGTNSESSFEVALLERAQDREVWGYDFTIDSFSPEIEKTPNPKKRGRNAHGPEDSPKSYTPERPQDGRLERSPPVVEQVKFAPYCPIGSVVLENGLSGLCVARNAVSVSNSAPSASFLSTSMNVWPKFPHEIRSLVNYNAGGKPRLAEYSFLNIRGDHSLVYEAADGADAY